MKSPPQASPPTGHHIIGTESPQPAKPTSCTNTAVLLDHLTPEPFAEVQTQTHNQKEGTGIRPSKTKSNMKRDTSSAEKPEPFISHTRLGFSVPGKVRLQSITIGCNARWGWATQRSQRWPRRCDARHTITQGQLSL